MSGSGWNRRWRWIGSVLPAAALCLMAQTPALAQVSVSAPGGQAWYDFGGGGSYLGVYLEDLSAGMRRALGLAEETGVLLERLTENGPAAKAGLVVGDVLLELGGKKIDSTSRLSRVLDRFDPGEKVEAIVWRQNKRKTFQITLKKRNGYAFAWGSNRTDGALAPLVAALRPSSYSSFFNPGGEVLGLRTEELTGQLATFFEVPHGVLVVWVRRDTRAARAGLKAGDVITSVEGQNIQNRDDLETTLQELRRSRAIEVIVVRKGKKKTHTIPE